MSTLSASGSQILEHGNHGQPCWSFRALAEPFSALRCAGCA
jgi:hypothetical protein